MRKRTKSPKGPRAAATRGTRGRGRTRGGLSRADAVNKAGASVPNSTRASNSRRGATQTSGVFSSDSKDNQNIISIERNGSGRSNGGATNSASDNLATPKPSSDYYLHKKFKKLTTTVVAESPELSSSAPCSSKSVHLSNGVSLDASSSSVPATSVAAPISNGLESPKPNGYVTSQSPSQDNPALSSSNMVYKPKFRISVETETSSSAASSSEPNRSESSTTSSPTATTSSTKPEDLSSMNLSRKSSTSSSTSSTEAGKIVKGLRLDRQSLDDRISKIIDENQSLLEWPEHFTKKLKSHTSRNSSSSSSSSHNHQRTSQVAIMSGGSTTELHHPQIPQNPSASSHPHSHLRLQNGLVRNTSFDMNSSGGTVEFLTNPLILKAQSDLLAASGYSQLVQTVPTDFSTSSPSLSELSALPLATAAAASLIVPKKRRRLSPTPSRLCGGEVSELPVSEIAISKSYYQDVDMTVRVSNCSGAKVTIRTNNGSGSGGSIQSAVGYGRLIDPAVPSPIAINAGNSSSLFFSPNSMVANLECTPFGGQPSCDAIRMRETHNNNSIPLGKCSPSSSSGKGGGNKRKHPQSSSRVPEITLEPLPLKLTVGDGKLPKKELLRESIVLSKEVKPSLSPEFPSPMRNTPPAEVKVPSVSPSQGEQPSRSSDEKVLPPPASPSNKSTPFQVLQTSSTHPKRPNFLALKPVNSVPKKSDVGVLPSPETPRVAKSYNQMFINGNAYTYLGFKVSTRSSYTCLFKPQPMFIPQNTDTKLSMYSNWQPCPKDPKDLQLDISTNDSRVNGRKSPQTLYTSATGRNCDTLTVSSPGSQAPILSPMAEKSPLAIFANELRGPVTSLSRSSEAVPPSSSLHDAKFPKLSPNIPNLIPSSSSPPQMKDKSCGGNNHSSGAPMSPRTSTIMTQSLLKTNQKVSSSFFSSSDLSSADECSNMGKSGHKRRRTDERSNSGGPLALTTKSKKERPSDKDFLPDDSNSASESVNSGVIMSRSDSSRVKIMEGGFESNEDYTYVRGRGRGRYVCEACGIRCKKPSMLRKHLKTHTDLRPYTCKLCNFSFKTKGNLTKHQKSKSHHKKCISMGIHPESSQSLAATGPNISDSNSDNDSDDDDDDCGDMDSDSQCDDDGDNASFNGNENESESVEKEIALSLLDLSSVSRLVSSASSSTTDSEWSVKEKQQKGLGFCVNTSTMLDEDKSPRSSITMSPAADATEAPMDLSVKSKPGSSASLVREPEPKRMKIEKNGLVRSIGVVGEAQLWEPEEVPNECLNLKKVLNTVNSPPPQNKPSPVEEAVPLVREIKQEVIEDSCENLPVRPNGLLPESNHRVRQDSEASNSSASLPAFPSAVTDKVNERSSTPNSSSGQGTSQSAPVKLHQPWLSPPDRPAKEGDKDSADPPPPPPPLPPPADIKAASSTLETINNKLLEEAKAKAAAAVGMSLAEQQLPDGVNAASKIFAALPGLKPQAEFRQPSGAQALVKEDGKAECNVCGKSFARASQLTLHMNIHYIERPFRCDPCGVSFRTKGHLIKHRRSSSHDCKVYLTEAWGVANEENPRPFKCPDCKIAFRIHGHLAKHLRSKMHIMRMECLGKLPFGIYFEMEKSGMNLNEIDTTDCDMSLVSLQNVARKIYGDNWMERLTVPVEEPA